MWKAVLSFRVDLQPNFLLPIVALILLEPRTFQQNPIEIKSSCLTSLLTIFYFVSKV